MPRLARPRPRSARSSSGVAPPCWAAITCCAKSLCSKRTGVTSFNSRLVAPSPAASTASLNAMCAELSGVATNRDPSCTASAPSIMAARMDRPSCNPPAAITGMSHASATAGTKHMVVVSSRPLCPPASKPSATTASTPASWAFKANLTLLTTCTTLRPWSCKCFVHVRGLPALVNTMGTPSSTMLAMCSSTAG